ncbi:hypothetical protein [Luteimonas lutimaris]
MSSRAISAVIAVCLAGCSSMAVDQALDLGTVVSDPARYDGQQIVVAACISVVIHGVALLPCGERAPYVAIDEPDTGRSKFSQLVSYAHKNMGAYPEELPVLVGGEFRAIGMNGREISSISVERFQPHQGY